MGKNIKSTQIKIVEKKFNRNLIYIPLAILLIKFFTIPNIITGVADIWKGAWPGADGEHYLTGTTGIVVDGIFSNSDKLTFWPAGYPLLMSIFAKITLGLKDYQETVGGSLETYLGRYSNALTETAGSLEKASAKQEDILEQLTEQLDKLNARRN